MIEFYEGTIYTIVVKKTEIKVILDHPTEANKQITCVILFN